MSDPYPTKTQLDLLRDVAEGYVGHASDSNDYRYPSGAFVARKVNATVAALARAGWVELRQLGGTREWYVTAAGRAVLDTHGGER